MAFDEPKAGFAPIVQMVHDHASQRPTAVAMRQKEFGIWNEITWSGLQEIMQACAAEPQVSSWGCILRHPRQSWII